ncbi:TetR/AcrR family transcriptional regulator [uncultured Microbacterium sp.]|uniref:TetR/AcrR family transcriptional regulator n=1 Tax=uncultured Microbacterium sp. TaxID=191216 RepID=UPI002625E122|nr:TetR/AcrR family transcriptional regulator [uncultured Microbacterium sp.]
MTIPVTKRRENTRARLLEAAAQVFAEVGLEGASVEAICERAGFTRGAFYSNFASKDELFLQLASAFAERRLVQVRASIAAFTESGELHSGADAFELVRRVLESGEEDRLSIMMMSEIRIRALRDEEFGAAYLSQERDLVDGIQEIIRGIVDAGLFSLRVDLETAARILMSVWGDAMVLGAIGGQSEAQMQDTGSALLGQLVELIVCEP